MARRTLIFAVVCLSLVGCAPLQRSDGLVASSGECNGAACQVDVSVSGSDIVVAPEYLIVNGPRNQVVNIIWRLPQGSPYSLKIEIIGGGDEFNCSAEGPRQFKCNNRHTGAKVYKYWVKLDGPNHLEKDPYIVND